MATLTETPAVDVYLTNAGSIVLLLPVSDQAEAWISENVESSAWQWHNGALSIDHRYAESIIEGMIGEGMVIR